MVAVATEASPSTEGVASITVDVDVHLKSPNALSNENHYTRAHRRAKEQKATLDSLSLYEPPNMAVSTCTILITRLGSRKLDDDNLAYCAKSVRDAIASWLTVDDADQRLTWKYDQQVVRQRKVDNGKRNFKPGFKSWCRVTLTLNGLYIQTSAPSSSSTTLQRPARGEAQAPPRVATSDQPPELEDIPTEDEPRQFHEPVIRWETKPGTDLVILPRMGGRERDVPVELHVTAKVSPQGVRYIHLSVWFPKRHGLSTEVRRWRSRGAAIREDELPAVVAALQAHMAKTG